MRRILVVAGEEGTRWSLIERLRRDGHEVVDAGTVSEALDRADTDIDLVLLDSILSDGEGLAVLGALHTLQPDLPVILLNAPRNVDAAAHAFDALPHPVDLNDIARRVSLALEIHKLRREVRTWRDSRPRLFLTGALIGASEPMQHVKSLVAQIAASAGAAVLITGERGTGKDLIANAVHYASHRADHPFLKVSCSALPETLLESDVFGHEPRAFAGLDALKRGLLEQADGGTLFLDRIDELAPGLQDALLRFLEDGVFRRVGGAVDLQVDVRVIAATPRPLEDHVRDGRFRDDLFNRLKVLRIDVPALRTRADDIPQLAQAFVEAFGREFDRGPQSLAPAAEQALSTHVWPGNVRELRNLVERAVLLSDADVLQPSDFGPMPVVHAPRGIFDLPDEGVNLEEVEKSLVIQALDKSRGNQTRAAALLGIHRDQIRYRIEKFRLGKKG